MNRFHTIRRLAVITTGLMGALLAFCAGAAPAAFASVLGGIRRPPRAGQPAARTEVS
jgi:hypothetical protein